MAYDLIGDIHGHAEPLIRLLRKLGYAVEDGVYRHPERQLIFLGDFIDRGPAQREVIDVVRPMIESGTALAVMGNHEFNAIAFATPDPDAPGEYLRPHSEKNRKQHAAFLAEYGATDDYEDLIAWFRQLPLWLDLGDIRVVHACWDEPCMTLLDQQFVSHRDGLSDALLIAASRKAHPAYTALETLLKGREIDLPHGQMFHDKDGNPRSQIRVKWWDTTVKTYREAFLGPDSALAEICDEPIESLTQFSYPPGAPPVLVGHYWMTGTPAPLAPNVACLDYSVAAKAGGKLVAYRWNGEQALRIDRFVSVARLG